MRDFLKVKECSKVLAFWEEIMLRFSLLYITRNSLLVDTLVLDLGTDHDSRAQALRS